MDLDEVKKKITLNGLQYQQSLRRIIRKYSILYNENEAIEVDVNNTDTKTLEHYMKMYEEQMKAKESESSLDSREDALQLHNFSSISQLDQTQYDGRHDETRVSCQTFADEEDDDGVSNLRSQQSSLDSSQWSFPEFDVLPEDQDEELELALRSRGSSLSELYPSMIDQIGRAQHRWRVSEMGSSVLQKYRKWRLQSGKGNHNHRRITSRKAAKNPGSKCTSWLCPTSRDQTVLALEQSCILESPKSKRIDLNKTITVEKQLSFLAFSPSSASLGTLSELSPNSRRFAVSAARMQPSVCILSPSRFSGPSSDQSLRSKILFSAVAEEQPSSWIVSPSRSSGSSSDQSLITKRFFRSAAEEKASSCTLSPSRSSCSSSDQSLITKRFFRSAAGENASSCTLSPSRSSGLSLDHSLRSKSFFSSAAREQPAFGVVSPSRSSGSSSDQSLITKRLLRSAAGENASSCTLSPSRSSGLSLDHSLRSKSFFSSAAREQPAFGVVSPSRSSGSSSDQSLITKRLLRSAAGENTSSCMLSPSQSSCSSLDQSLLSKRLFSPVAEEQPSSWVVSPSRSSGPSLDQSLRSKRFFSPTAREQTSSVVLSPSRSPGPSLDQTLRSKRLALAVAQEQQQPSLCVLSPSQSPGPSTDQSLRSKRLFSPAAREQPSSGVLSPSLSPGPSLDQSPRSKRLALAAAQEQNQQSSWVLSPSRDFGPSLELSLGSKRLARSAAADEHQQLSSWQLSPSRSWSQSSKSLFPTADKFEEQPDVYGFPIRQSPLKVRMVNTEGLRRSPQAFPRSPNFADALGNSRSPAPPLRKLLTPQTLQPESILDDEFTEYYHKFVCQSKRFNEHPCRLCAGRAGARRRRRHHCSQTLAALALSPHCFKLGKRHRVLERNNLSCSEPKRHRNEMLRCPPDDEAPRSTSRGFSRRRLWEDSDQAHGLP
ncbi:uncharacterized protein LOC144062613 [Vanacampus margaritifer]